MDIFDFLAPFSLTEWVKEYWGNKPFRHPVNKPLMTELLTVEEMHYYLKNPKFYQTNAVLLRSTSFTSIQKAQSYADVLAGIAAGLTLQVRNIESVLPKDSKLIQLANSIQTTSLFPLDSITFFQSQPQSQPTAIHKDISEIFSIQLAGKKRWLLAQEKEFSDKMAYEEGEITAWDTHVLEPGDVMYLSSYLPHQVKCVEEESISVAMVFPTIQYTSFFEYLKEDPALKQWLLRAIPPMGEQALMAENTIEMAEFKSILLEKISSLDMSNYFMGFIRPILTDMIAKKMGG